MPLSKDHKVEKSNDLILSNMSQFNAPTLKLFDIYLSRINQRDPDTSHVTFTKQEFCAIMGLHPKTKIDSLKNALNSLKTALVEFPIETEKAYGIRSAVLFTTSDILIDKDTRETTISMKANPDIEPLFFHLQNSGYTQYALGNTIDLNSKYSILLYKYLRMKLGQSHKPSTDVYIPVDVLRDKILKAEGDHYRDFRFFREKILDRSIKEINERTNIRVDMDFQRDGKSISLIIFHVENAEMPVPENIIDEPLYTIEDEYEEEQEISEETTRVEKMFDL